MSDDDLNGSAESFARFPEADRARYRSLVERVERPGDLALDAVDHGNGVWAVAVAAADFVGALAVIAGLLTAHRLDILEAEIVTLRLPSISHESRTRRPGVSRSGARHPGRTPIRRLLDVFTVRVAAAESPDLWNSFRRDLAAVFGFERPEEARDEVIGRVSDAFLLAGQTASQLFPIQVDVANSPGSPTTELTVRSADTPGFLFAFANALAGLTINIERAEIRTEGGEARDRFWVTDLRGRPIVEAKSIDQLRIATTLIKQFTFLLPRSPDPGQAIRQFSSLISQMLSRPEWTAELVSLESAAVLEKLADLMGVSRFLWEDFLRMQHESLFPLLVDSAALDDAPSPVTLRQDLNARLASTGSLAERIDALNDFKDREMFRIDMRHLVGHSSFATFSQELTSLAEVAVEAAIQLAEEELQPKFGRPLLADGRECPFCVCALGKFGGGELGFGSDLELIFVYGQQGRTSGPNVTVNSEYFGQLVQTFLRTLRARQQGIFEVDLRLRPFGKAGALASSLDGFATYYSNRGAAEQFERFALVRLRPVAGDPLLGEQIRQARDAFVYSGRSLDLANVLHLRQRQATELVPRGEVNAKYSSGGLVDLEYFVQFDQIIGGAADPALRVTHTLDAVRRLADAQLLRPELASDLVETYDFLRRLIDALRVVRGHAKDLTIPPAGSRELAYLARRLGFGSPGELRQAIETRMAFARGLWTSVLPIPVP
jgi:glutamate-ammonia-ligase adenylyltransferase